MREATQRFAELEGRIAQTNSVLQDTRRLENSVYALQIVLSDFLSNSSKDNLVRLQQQAGTLGKDMQVLTTSAKGMGFAEGISEAIQPALDAISGGGSKIVDTIGERVTAYAAARQELDQIWTKLTDFAELQKQTAGTERTQANSISVLTTGLGILLSILGGIAWC